MKPALFPVTADVTRGAVTVTVTASVTVTVTVSLSLKSDDGDSPNSDAGHGDAASGLMMRQLEAALTRLSRRGKLLIK